MWATVGKHSPAQGQARQAKSKKENRYVIKVMSLNKEGGQVFWFARTKGCPKPFHWPLLRTTVLNWTYQCKAGLKWNTGYLLFTIVRYNYKDYNTPSKPNMHTRIKLMYE